MSRLFKAEMCQESDEMQNTQLCKACKEHIETLVYNGEVKNYEYHLLQAIRIQNTGKRQGINFDLAS